MRPVEPDVAGQRVVMKGPPGSDVADLVVAATIDGLVSEWEFTVVERAAILAGAHVRLGIVSNQHPVVWLGVVGCDE